MRARSYQGEPNEIATAKEQYAKEAVESLARSPITPDEIMAVLRAIKGSLDLYTGYLKLNPEHQPSPWLMKRKQGQLRRQIGLLESAQLKLKHRKELT